MTPADPAPQAVAADPTRERLVDAAIEIVARDGASALTTVEVCRRVGIAQSSFYSHFATRDDLLSALAVVVAAQTSVPNRRARLAFEARRDAGTHRELFRVPLQMISDAPELFRLHLIARAAPADTALGAQARQAQGSDRAQVTDHLMKVSGVDDPGLRRRHEMAADCISAMLARLAEGHIDGRYPDLEEVVDLLVLLTGWGRATSTWLTTAPDHTADPGGGG